MALGAACLNGPPSLVLVQRKDWGLRWVGGKRHNHTCRKFMVMFWPHITRLVERDSVLGHTQSDLSKKTLFWADITRPVESDYIWPHVTGSVERDSVFSHT